MLARVRIDVLDRPGSLGRVASAIGAVSADIAALDVLETEAGRALDDVLVQVRDDAHLARVTAELASLPGVTVVGTQHPAPPASGHSELELVHQVLARPERAAQTLVDGAPGATGADWAAIVEFDPDGAQRAVLALSTRAPGADAVRVRAPLRLGGLRLAPAGGGEPWSGAALVPLDAEPLGLLLVRERGVDFHRTELWRLGHLGALVGPVVARAVAAA